MIMIMIMITTGNHGDYDYDDDVYDNGHNNNLKYYRSFYAPIIIATTTHDNYASEVLDDI